MNGQSRKHHIQQTIKLSIPLVISQLTVMMIGVVDTIMSGRLGTIPLAAVSIGGAIWAIGVMFVLGILMATPPMISELDGAKQRDKIGALVRQLMWLALIIGIIFFILIRNLTPLFTFFGTQVEVIPVAIEYLQAISWGILSFPMFLVFRYVADGLSHTRMTMYISFLALALNIPLNYILMFGKLGFPALGVAGCGYASAIVILIQATTFGLVLAKHRWFKELKIFSRIEKPDKVVIFKVLSIGLPIGIALFAEGGFFSVITMLASRLSPEVIAAHQISLNFASVLFMIPLGMSMAITVRVGNAIGRKSKVDIRRAGMIGIGLILIVQIFLAGFMFAFPELVVNLYTQDLEVQTIALQLLFFAAIFQLSDGIQVAAAGALRGIQDTKFLMYATTIAFWGFGFAASWWFCFEKDMGAAGLWIGLILGLSIAAILNFLRFHHKTLVPT
ncbi:Multi antimicrobial extrusion protein (Na(+)/drug antiporter), MATE family of MDR efflux pumps [hydrothermal vent metagenome]|uniref:Multidrug-efflux transporter n=1 Tax=hydrothermal vent metagenome TaxID=652676 RepID=A0A3B0VHA0_9ZZZZ